jgi:hypothetical protein
MIQVHTVYETSGWRNKVDGLQQGPPFPDRLAAAAQGRLIALELRGAHIVHDVDGTIIEQHRYGTTRVRSWVDPVRFQS